VVQFGGQAGFFSRQARGMTAKMHSLKFLASKFLRCIFVAGGRNFIIFSSHDDFNTQPPNSH